MQKEVYIIIDGIQKGPFSLSKLLMQNFSKPIQVWTEGFDDWVEVKNVEELKSLFQKPKTQFIETPSAISKPTAKVVAKKTQPVDLAIEKYEIASVGKRFIAHVVNVIVFYVLYFIVMELIENPEKNDFANYSTLLIPKLISIFTYAAKSGNIGHIILRLKVVNKTTGDDFKNPLLGLLREIAKFFMFPFLLPIIYLVFDKDIQNAYDKLFNTVVIKNKPQENKDVKPTL